MNEQALAEQIAAQVLKDTQFWIAIVGLIGGVIGGALTLAGNVLLHWLQGKKQSELDAQCILLLTQMLQAKDWRFLSTLSRVVGASQEETRRLLIKLGSRASEKARIDGDESWGLLSKHPLNQVD